VLYFLLRVTKKKLLVTFWLTWTATLLVCFPLYTHAKNEKKQLAQFNQIAEHVEVLKKTNLVLALKQLTVFDNLLDKLSVDQKLLYYKLVAEIYIEQNQYTKSNEFLNTGLSLAKHLSSPSILISELLYLRGFSFESLGDIIKATQDYKKGLEVAESLHNKVLIASGLINLGAIAYLTDDYQRSLILLNDAYNIAEQTDDDELKGNVNSELGIVYAYVYQEQKAMAYYQKSYEHFKQAGMLLSAHNSLNNIAINHNIKKEYSQAITVLQTIIAESNKDSPSSLMYSVYSSMAWAYLKKEQANAEAAYQYLLKAKQYIKATDQHDVQLQFHIDEAFILYQLTRYDEALVSINAAEKILANQQSLTQLKKQAYINIVNLRAKVSFEKKAFKDAYQLKSEVIKLTERLYEKEDSRSIAEVRLSLEGEQADIQSEILQNQQALHEASLVEAKFTNEEQRLYLVISALVTLAFAWLLVKLIQSQHKLNIATSIDSLTQIENRRSLMKSAQLAFNHAKNRQNQLSILMIDIDHFKFINDNLGHHCGDEVLKIIAQLSATMLRKSDVLGRYGGEEFMVCLPNTELTSAIEIAQRIRLCIEQHDWQFSIDKLTVSVSIGVSSLRIEGRQTESVNDLYSLIKIADEQLYRAKFTGRNKVCSQ
jgi:diguanylate cyclase (GGDEF)-like protein